MNYRDPCPKSEFDNMRSATGSIARPAIPDCHQDVGSGYHCPAYLNVGCVAVDTLARKSEEFVRGLKLPREICALTAFFEVTSIDFRSKWQQRSDVKCELARTVRSQLVRSSRQWSMQSDYWCLRIKRPVRRRLQSANGMSHFGEYSVQHGSERGQDTVAEN